MVVLVIVAILAGLVAGALRSDPGRAVEAEAWRLARLVERLPREAALTGEVLALRWQAGGYAVERRDPQGGWKILESDAVFAPRRFAAGLVLAGQGEAIFVPEEDNPPLRLTLTDGAAAAVIEVDALGEAMVKRNDALSAGGRP